MTLLRRERLGVALMSMFAGFFLASCQSAELHTAMGPTRKVEEISLKDPQNTIVLIWSPGSRDRRVVQACRPWNTPFIISGFDNAKINGNVVKVYHLCSFASGQEHGYVVQARAADIIAVAERFRKAGVPPKKIFLTGQSFGAWSSLYAAAGASEKINAVIVFAPGLYGPRDQRSPRAEEAIFWQMGYFGRSKKLAGIVFAHELDEIFRPQDLTFVAQLPHLELVALPHPKQPSLKEISVSCYGHLFVFDPCTEDFREFITRYISRRTK